MSTLSQFYGFGQVIPSTYIPIDYLVIGGGGSGGGNRGTSVAGGGGGAGAYINGTGFIVVPGTTYTVTVGAGGVYDNQANQGGDGGFSRLGNIYAWGGGGGGGAFIDAKNVLGSTGGNGQRSPSSTGSITYLERLNVTSLFDLGKIPSSYSISTYEGGGSYSTGAYWPGAGGGGGANQAGTRGGTQAYYDGGKGGNGKPSTITGTAVTRAGGGGGGSIYPSSYYGGPGLAAGGQGGGGGGGWHTTAGFDGSANTGSGGGGAAGSALGGNGGSGTVIIRYPDTFPAPASITGSYTTLSVSGFRGYQWTGSGSIRW